MGDGPRVVLGVSGGIAAYKAVELCRRMVDAGAHVMPVLTEDATRFVGAVTFSALASEPARLRLFDAGDDPIPHTHLGQTADVVIVAPATARLIGKYTAGISDDLLSATLLATRAPVVVAPAMHTEMWEHPAVQENLATLTRRGVHVVEATHVDRRHPLPVRAGAGPVRRDAARLAEHVVDLLLPKLVHGLRIRALLDVERARGREREQVAAARADRAVARGHLVERELDVEAHRAAVASAGVGLGLGGRHAPHSAAAPTPQGWQPVRERAWHRLRAARALPAR